MDVLINGEIVLYGTVGAQFLSDIGFFTDLDVAAALATIGAGDVRVRINSGGGYSDQGVAIFNLLKGHAGKVHVSVDGVAASAGSVIAMAGDTITMKQGSIMMVHNSQSLSVGNVKDHEKTIEALQVTDSAMADIYASRTGRPLAQIKKEMADETWMTADVAVAQKYATSVEAAASMRAAAFDYRLYNHAPERMVALATMLAGDWSPTPPTPPTPEEPPHVKFWEFMKSHAKAASALAASLDATFNGQPLASNNAFAEIWNAAQSGVAADWTPKGELVAIDGASIVRAEAIRRELTEVAAACAMMGKPERAVGFIRSGSTCKAAVATLQAERVAAQGVIHTHATGMSHAASAGGVDQNEINRGWATAIDAVNKRHMPTATEIYARREAERQARTDAKWQP